ncbi:hypothetical protein [Hymenobacter pini]|uniref:hypothetical protein n=1 Tax=Hymenobacter pini TaxID=2880879 RepID=UPI001CF1A366|nr:hypothetical protein [Hymenobacter pini]MCA8830492.1 hypothetical protein [Hymenobacter pini]
MAEGADRETPGIFQLWERDIAEVRENPAAIHNVGGCEQEQLVETMFCDYAALGAALLVYYEAGLYTSEDLEVEGEINDETLEREEADVQAYLTFDLRSFLKSRQSSWLPIQRVKFSISSFAWPFYKAGLLKYAAFLQVLFFRRDSAGTPEIGIGYQVIETLLGLAHQAGEEQAYARMRSVQEGGPRNG